MSAAKWSDVRLDGKTLPRTEVSAQRDGMSTSEEVTSMLEAARERSLRPAAARDDQGSLWQMSTARANSRSRAQSYDSKEGSTCEPFNCLRAVRVRWYHAFPSTSPWYYSLALQLEISLQNAVEVNVLKRIAPSRSIRSCSWVTWCSYCIRCI